VRGRAVVAWGLAFLIACPARAERRWLPGTPMRVTVATPGMAQERIEGRLVATGDTLVLEIPRDRATAFDTLLIATSDVTRAEVSEGPRKPGSATPIAMGLLMGAVGFAAIGLYLLSQFDHGPKINGMVLLVGGTAAAAVLGGWLTTRGQAAGAPPEWREVPVSWLRES
jgi:hypothetical protein